MYSSIAFIYTLENTAGSDLQGQATCTTAADLLGGHKRRGLLRGGHRGKNEMPAAGPSCGGAAPSGLPHSPQPQPASQRQRTAGHTTAAISKPGSAEARFPLPPPHPRRGGPAGLRSWQKRSFASLRPASPHTGEGSRSAARRWQGRPAPRREERSRLWPQPWAGNYLRAVTAAERGKGPGALRKDRLNTVKEKRCLVRC